MNESPAEIDRIHSLLFVCGQCRWYEPQSKTCPRCFPNTINEPNDNACLYFAKKQDRRMFRNIPRR